MDDIETNNETNETDNGSWVTIAAAGVVLGVGAAGAYVGSHFAGWRDAYKTRREVRRAVKAEVSANVDDED